MTKAERAMLKAVRATVRYFEEDGKGGPGWKDDTELYITRADEGESDFTLGDLRKFVAQHKGKR